MEFILWFHRGDRWEIPERFVEAPNPLEPSCPASHGCGSRRVTIGGSTRNASCGQINFWLGFEPTPLKNTSLSVGMMKFPTEWKDKFHVPVTTNQIYHGVPFHDHLWSRISSLVTHHSQGIGRGAVGAQFLNGSGGKANLVAWLPRWGGNQIFGGQKWDECWRIIGIKWDTGYNKDTLW
jgi:hypothetical protein